MMDSEEIRKSVDAIPYWYHRIHLTDEITTPGWAPMDVDAYRVPKRLDGEMVLDVGAWDGFWTFEALNRGALYSIAIDDFSDELGTQKVSREDQWRTFDLCKSALGTLDCDRHTVSVYDVDKLGLKFDRIFCFGLIYHLRYPLLALDKLRKVCNPGATIHIESAVLDQFTSVYTGEVPQKNACHAEFYPTTEFGANQSNWWVPTLKCLGAMMEAAGFSEVQTWYLTPSPIHLSQCRGFASGKAK